MFKITEHIDSVNDMDADFGKWRNANLPCPKSVKISLNDNCNFACGFCVNSTQHEKPIMPWEMFTTLIDELVEHGVEEIGLFFIGEPFIDKRLLDAVKYVKSKKDDMYIYITTNGSLSTVERVEPLMAAGLSSLKFSYNYADGTQLKNVAHVKERYFDKLVENIKAVRKMRDEKGYKCGIYASSIMFDGLQAERMKQAVELVKDYLDEHYYLPQYSFGGQTDFGEQVFGNPGRYDRQRHTLPCWVIFREGHVTADGAVALCSFDVHDNWKAGSLKDGTFMQAWNSPVAQALRAKHLTLDVRGTACEACAHGTQKKHIKITKVAA